MTQISAQITFFINQQMNPDLSLTISPCFVLMLIRFSVKSYTSNRVPQFKRFNLTSHHSCGLNIIFTLAIALLCISKVSMQILFPCIILDSQSAFWPSYGQWNWWIDAIKTLLICHPHLFYSFNHHFCLPKKKKNRLS